MLTFSVENWMIVQKIDAFLCSRDMQNCLNAKLFKCKTLGLKIFLPNFFFRVEINSYVCVE